MSNNGSAALAADGFFLAWAETLSMVPRGGWGFPGMGRNSKYGPSRRMGFPGMGRNSKYGQENAGAALIEPPAHTCRFAQPYSSWGCSPAEPHYASDCGAKVVISFRTAKPFTGFLLMPDKKKGKRKYVECCISGKICVTLQGLSGCLSESMACHRCGDTADIEPNARGNVRIFQKRQAFQDSHMVADKVFSTMQKMLTSNSV